MAGGVMAQRWWWQWSHASDATDWLRRVSSDQHKAHPDVLACTSTLAGSAAVMAGSCSMQLRPWLKPLLAAGVL
jgi:hypothetical protein